MTKDIRICFVGDSLVNGTGDEMALGWAGRLCAMAHTRGSSVTYYNLGIRRNTSKDILEDSKKHLVKEFIDNIDTTTVVEYCEVFQVLYAEMKLYVDNSGQVYPDRR